MGGAEALLSAGVDTALRDKAGMKCIDDIRSGGDARMAVMLTQHP